jgi:hypothetical protein
MWKVTAEYRQGREVKDDKKPEERERERGRERERERESGLEKRLDRITISDI